MRGSPRRRASRPQGTECRASCRAARIALGVIAALSALEPAAHAYPPREEAGRLLPCVTVERVEGDVRLLDEERIRAVPAVPGSAVGCGGWIAAREGWVRVRHRDGHVVVLGRATHVQVRDAGGDAGAGAAQAASSTPGQETEHWSLLDGELHIDAENASAPVRVRSANAVARLDRASALVIYAGTDEATQLVALSGAASLANRFLPGRPTALLAGEATRLDFASERVRPATPRAVRPGELRRKLVSLQVETADAARFLRLAETRAGRAVPKDLMHLMGMEIAALPEAGAARRAPAAAGPTADDERRVGEYARHALAAEERDQLEAMAMARLTGQPAGTVRRVKSAAAAPAPAADGRSPAGLQIEERSRLDLSEPVAAERRAIPPAKARSTSPRLRAAVARVRTEVETDAAREARERQRLIEALSQLRPEE